MSMHSLHWVNKVNVVFLSGRVSIPEPLHGTRRKLISSVYANVCQVNFILFISCTDVTVLHKNPSNALICVNTTSFALLHSYMFQPKWGLPQGVLIHFVRWVYKVHFSLA